MATVSTTAQALESSVEQGIAALLDLCGRDVASDSGIAKTPKRFLKAMLEMTEGTKQDPAEILSTKFEVETDELIILRGVDFVSLCEHHLLPFTGKATVAYIPKPEKPVQVVGLSKLARLIECFAKRFQVQERMTRDIAHSLFNHLSCSAAACIVVASHSCMSCRGIKKANADMITSCMLGTFRDDASQRAELLALAR